MIFMVGNLVLGFLAFVVLIVALIRSVWASLAFPVLFANPGMTAKEALSTSISATMGKWWVIVIYSIALTIFIGMFNIVMNVLLALSGRSIFAIVVVVLMALAACVFAFLQMTFKQLLSVELKSRGAEIHL